MLQYLWLIPALPFIGFLILALFGRYLNKTMASIVGVGSVSISAVVTLLIGYKFLHLPAEMQNYTQYLWTWFNVAGFQPTISLHVDALSMVFIFVITFVGFLIHLYSSEYMSHEEGFARFFAYMNLFVGSMLILVLSDNLLLLYLGWEGVGLCSYLLIGFFYKDSENNYAARKAFITTRIGDTAMLIGLLLLIFHFNTLSISEVMAKASISWGINSPIAIAVAALLLGGAVGKSAQLPLQVWLPDAMAGPSPVSALIHAATMVTAGVYLIARTHILFAMAPTVQFIVAVIGALTLLIAGISALGQSDLKRVLAYSTISQIGYMFLALGVGAWSAAVFHFMIHAFFKALLFLGAGAVIMALHHQQDMYKMGGLRKKLPVIFWTFLIGSASLAALPLVTAGFYSKDSILWYSIATSQGSVWLWLAGYVGAAFTAVYTFRMVFLTFWGEEKTHVHYFPKWRILLPLVVLAILTSLAGFIELPENMGHLTLFSNFVTQYLPITEVSNHTIHEWVLQLASAIISILGVMLAYYLYVKKPVTAYIPNALQRFMLSGCGFDKLYDLILIKPFLALTRTLKTDWVDWLITLTARVVPQTGRLVNAVQTGNLYVYVSFLSIAIIVTITIMLFV